MKNLKLILVLIILTGFFKIVFPQISIINECPHSQFIEGMYSPSNVTGGLYKPHRTDVSGAPYNASFKVLLVFVQFANESIAADYWPIGQAPTYMNELLAVNKNTNGNYWERYDPVTAQLSAWYQEVSRGQMHVTGVAYNIILDNSSTYYQSAGMREMNNEIFTKLTAANVDWEEYDQWSGSDGNFYYLPDNYIDMMIKVHRTMTVSGLFYGDAPGYAFLGPDASGIDISVGGGKYVNDGWSSIGSGLTLVGTAGGPVGKEFAFNGAKHEIGHYWFGGGHSGSAIGIMGGEVYLGAWESLKLGYQVSTEVSFNTSYSLYDISSRYSNGEILKVPINGPYEYFLIENRRQVSYFDRTMIGDTAKGKWDRVLSSNVDYGKGVYIYHHAHDMTYYGSNDMECADGLWNWTLTGQTTPDWSSTQILNVYEKTSLPSPVLNDYGNESTPVFTNKDGRTVSYGAYFGRGKRHTVLNGEATDRMFTTDEDLWTKREYDGDRYDAWNIGYNEVFSPYSNPNTKSWNNNNTTNIFIYYHTFNSSTKEAQIDIYKVDEDNTLESILEATPPSRPMGVTVDYYWASENICHPRITWLQNQEPDMVNSLEKKKYKLYRAFKLYMNQVPGPPELIASDLEFYPNETPTYIDNQIVGYLSTLSGDEAWLYPVRYWVKAVDKYSDESVYSDFASAIGIWDGSNIMPPSGGDNAIAKEKIPTRFDLKQNYPNPFNPVTNIKYDLPKDVFVTVKIYDILGREIKTLVNEFKNAGSYIISFNGSELASGIYFYRIQAGSFVSVKRMVLVK
jgi:hypothetical protein